MAMSGNPIARKLYLRIWLAVAGSVLVLSVLVGGAWHMAEQEREHDRQAGQPREVLVRDAAGELIGTAEAQPRRLPGQGLEFVVTLRDGQVLMAHHDTVLQAEDHLIIFVHGRHRVRQIEKLTQVKLGFF